MIDPKLLANFTDAEAARVRDAIAKCDARHLHILEGLDQPSRLKYLLANSEGEKLSIRRIYWMEKQVELSQGLKAAGAVTLATLGAMAVYPGGQVTGTEVAALCALSAALAGTGLAIDRTKEAVAKRITSAISKKAAQYIGPAVEVVESPRVTQQTLNSLASIARRMQEKGPQERDVCQILGRIISRHNGALALGVEPDATAQSEQLHKLRTKLDEMAEADPMTAREYERKIAVSLNSYGMSLPPSPKNEASLPQRSRGFALGA